MNDHHSGTVGQFPGDHGGSHTHRVLLIDDDDTFRQSSARVLEGAGFRVRQAASWPEARPLLDDSIDVLLCDIVMPDYTGLDVLAQVSNSHPSLPVVLITGLPSLDTAIRALDLGAFRYLVKPFPPKKLLSMLDHAANLRDLARAQKNYLATTDMNRLVKAHNRQNQVFSKAVESIHLAFQPIVSWSRHTTAAYEALLRCPHPDFSNPEILVEAADRLNRVTELGRIVRRSTVEAIPRAPTDTLIFINVYPQELWDPDLLSPTAGLLGYAERIVLEITERQALKNDTALKDRVGVLREKGYRIAIDDLGTGYSSLSVFTVVEPDIVKLDISLVRNLDTTPVKQKLVRSVVSLCKEMGIQTVAEGIETPGECKAAVELGCDLLQGFLFARPAALFVSPCWDAVASGQGSTASSSRTT